MIRALLSGKKTQTRRVVKPGGNCTFGSSTLTHHDHDFDRAFPDGSMLKVPFKFKKDEWEADPGLDTISRLRPKWEKGDLLWVKEAWAQVPWITSRGNEVIKALYRADEPCLRDWNPDNGDRWKSPIFMPRWASRITLEVKGVRVERLQDISQSDALAEGATPDNFGGPNNEWCNAIGCFRELWDSINGKKHPWESNPWVWVIDFERVEQDG